MNDEVSRRAVLAGATVAFLAACSNDASRSRAAHPASTRTTSTTSSTSTSTTVESAAPAGPARFVRSGPTRGDRVALTFHGSGDVALTTRLLDAATSSRVPLTIFAVGRWLDDQPEMARRILDGGHELANHTYTHPVLGRLGATAVDHEIAGCREALTRHAGAPGRWFRPSGMETPTALVLSAAGRAGYDTVVGYDVDPHDYQDPGADAVASRVRAGLHAGAIVSLHTGHAGTVDAFPRIVDAISRAGLHPVRVTDLLVA